MKKTLEERFWSKVDVRGEDDCWLWTASCNSGGHGQLMNGRTPDGRSVPTLAHRQSWELANGPVPHGLIVRHLCESRYTPGDLTCRKCVNPAHLTTGTRLDNAADSAAAGRRRHGENHPNTTIDESKVLLVIVYRLAGRTCQDIADTLGVSRGHVGRICNGTRRSWKPTLSFGT